jgi:hypothetical protein
MNPQTRTRRVALAASLGLLLASSAGAQVSFSVDAKSDTVGLVDPTSLLPIRPACVLAPSGGAPALGPLTDPPIVVLGPADLGLGSFPMELDALSFGADAKFSSGAPSSAGVLWFSVDRLARGRRFRSVWPTVASERAGLAREASQDLFVDLGLPYLPAGPASKGGSRRHVGALDGDGEASPSSGLAYPGLGLLEPGARDSVDAFDLDHDGGGDGSTGDVFFSLEQGSASTLGHSGGDVLRADAKGILGLYASAADLGLDVAGHGTDDLDALVIWDDGDGRYTPPNSVLVYEEGDDRILFSVRRGSAVIGQTDSIFGVPIVEGDLLVPPSDGATYPGIFVAAEQLGLVALSRVDPSQPSDDLVAADLVAAGSPLMDANGNGVEDAVDIALRTSRDRNGNGIPDETELE